MTEIIELKNGLKVIYEKIDRVKSVSMGIFVKNGSKNEEDNNSGISHFIEHMLFKGTKNRSSKEILEKIDFVGGSINASTSTEYTIYTCKILEEYFNVGIEILSDMYINSIFKEEEIEKEKKVVIEEILMYDDLPEEKIHDLNSETILKGLKYSNPVLGSKKSVNSLKRDDILKFYKKRYGINNTYISIAGNIEKDKLVELLENNFGSFNHFVSEKNEDKEFILNSGKYEFYKDTSQVHICVNGKGLPSNHNERYSLMLLSEIIGGNMSSRLFQKIREEKGLAYSVYTYLSSYFDGGVITAYAGTTPENQNLVTDLILSEYKDLAINGITQYELDKTRNQLLSDLTISLESSKAVMLQNIISYIKFNKIYSLDEKINKIKAITVDDVFQIAKEAFNEKNISVVKYGKIK